MMRGMAMVLVVFGLLLTPVAGTACPSRSQERVPVALFEHCLEKDMRAGTVQHVSVTERDVRWFVKGSPEIRVERIRLAPDEVSRLQRLSSYYGACPARRFTVSVVRAQARRPSVAAQLAPSLGMLALSLVLLLWSVRRARNRVRVLTRQVERREAWVLAYTTLAVAVFVWGTWPDRQNSTVDRLQHRVRANLVHQATFTGDTVTWKEVGRRTTFVAKVPGGEAEAATLYKQIRSEVVHTRNPDRPNEVLHRVAVDRQRGPLATVMPLLPWLIAGFFWCAWVRMIRKSCSW